MKINANNSEDQAPRSPSAAKERTLSTILWVVAASMVILLVGLVIITKPAFLFASSQAATSEPAAAIVSTVVPIETPAVEVVSYNPKRSVVRALNPHTDLPDLARPDAVNYTVADGDSLFALSKKFDLKPETIFWANFDALGGSPDMISPGVELVIPPTDGVYYEWQDGDTIQAVADKFFTSPEDLLENPFNRVDLTDPKIDPGSFVMLTDGKREAVQWFQGQIPRGSAGTLSKLLGDGGCDTSGGGAVGSGSFGNPIPGGVIIGNDYIAGVHQGIDLGSASSSTIVAADSGVVVYSGWANGGYGFTVMVDHGNGFQTLYAHMLYTTVSCGASVGRGAQIGVVGSTGNSTGPHLHFEIRYMGLNDNPHNYF